MELLKHLEGFLFVDKFQREAICDFGFICGLHSWLTHWDDLFEKLATAMKERQEGWHCVFEVYRKSVRVCRET